MRKHLYNRKQLVLVLAVLTGMLQITAVPALADSENITGRGGTGYSAEKWAQLNDNVMEYDELPDLVHEFNSSIGEVWDKLEDTQEDLQGYIEELESAKIKIEHLEDSTKDKIKGGDYSYDTLVEKGTYSAILNGASIGGATLPSMGSLIGTFKNQADSLLMSKSTVNSIKKGENQIVKAAQQLMITYKSLEKQKQTLDTMAQMYDEQYQITLNKQAQGMATDLEVLTAQSNQLYAASLSASVASGMLQLKPTLCSLTGWAADADPVIAEIPTVDLSEIDQLNLEEDTQKAIGNNTTLISQRTSAKGKTSDGIEARIAMIDEGDQKLTIKMKSLYDDVMAKKTAFEAAQDGYQAALKNREKYKRMQEVGYLNRADFIGTEISYYTEEANYHAADTALRLSLETYKWAVKGLTEIE
jgi:hypothetical protein